MRGQKRVPRGWSWGAGLTRLERVVGGRESEVPSRGASQATQREFELDSVKVLSGGVTSSQPCLRMQLPGERREAGWHSFGWKMAARFCDSHVPRDNDSSLSLIMMLNVHCSTIYNSQDMEAT